MLHSSYPNFQNRQNTLITVLFSLGLNVYSSKLLIKGFRDETLTLRKIIHMQIPVKVGYSNGINFIWLESSPIQK